MIIFYNILLFAGIVFCFPLIVLAVILSEKRRKTVLRRLGFRVPDSEFRIPDSDPLWVHALSVGEVLSAVPLVKALRERFGDTRIFFSASTKTGFEIAKERLGKDADAIFFFPYDLIFSVKRISNRIGPAAVVIVETDIWPNFLQEMKRRKVPVLLVNARLSERSFRGYRRFLFFTKSVFSGFSKICTQSSEDARRFALLGLPPDAVETTGNIKFDQIDSAVSEDEALTLRMSLNMPGARKILVAGSTHEGEEIVLSEVFSRIRERFREFSLIVAPRDPARSKAVRGIFDSAGWSACSLSDLEKTEAEKAPDVVVIDRIGLLGKLYALAHVAFVGGSLVPLGGHNPLEPAAFSKPVLFGPHMNDFREISEMLLESGGAVRVGNAESFCETALGFLSDEKKARDAGERALKTFESNKGALGRTLDVIERLMVSPQRR